MRLERSLLERIDHAEEKPVRESSPDTKKILQSVLRHLQDMFNTRQGSVSILPDYGSPDFNDVVSNFPDAIKEIRQMILHNVKEYEPRLKNVRVKEVSDPDNPLNLQFEIAAQLNLGKKNRSAVKFTTIMGESGRIKVRE